MLRSWQQKVLQRVAQGKWRRLVFSLSLSVIIHPFIIYLHWNIDGIWMNGRRCTHSSTFENSEGRLPGCRKVMWHSSICSLTRRSAPWSAPGQNVNSTELCLWPFCFKSSISSHPSILPQLHWRRGNSNASCYLVAHTAPLHIPCVMLWSCILFISSSRPSWRFASAGCQAVWPEKVPVHVDFSTRDISLKCLSTGYSVKL